MKGSIGPSLLRFGSFMELWPMSLVATPSSIVLFATILFSLSCSDVDLSDLRNYKKKNVEDGFHVSSESTFLKIEYDKGASSSEFSLDEGEAIAVPYPHASTYGSCSLSITSGALRQKKGGEVYDFRAIHSGGLYAIESLKMEVVDSQYFPTKYVRLFLYGENISGAAYQNQDHFEVAEQENKIILYEGSFHAAQDISHLRAFVNSETCELNLRFNYKSLETNSMVSHSEEIVLQNYLGGVLATELLSINDDDFWGSTISDHYGIFTSTPDGLSCPYGGSLSGSACTIFWERIHEGENEYYRDDLYQGGQFVAAKFYYDHADSRCIYGGWREGRRCLVARITVNNDPLLSIAKGISITKDRPLIGGPSGEECKLSIENGNIRLKKHDEIFYFSAVEDDIRYGDISSVALQNGEGAHYMRFMAHGEYASKGLSVPADQGIGEANPRDLAHYYPDSIILREFQDPKTPATGIRNASLKFDDSCELELTYDSNEGSGLTAIISIDEHYLVPEDDYITTIEERMDTFYSAVCDGVSNCEFGKSFQQLMLFNTIKSTAHTSIIDIINPFSRTNISREDIKCLQNADNNIPLQYDEYNNPEDADDNSCYLIQGQTIEGQTVDHSRPRASSLFQVDEKFSDSEYKNHENLFRLKYIHVNATSDLLSDYFDHMHPSSLPSEGRNYSGNYFLVTSDDFTEAEEVEYENALDEVKAVTLPYSSFVAVKESAIESYIADLKSSIETNGLGLNAFDPRQWCLDHDNSCITLTWELAKEWHIKRTFTDRFGGYNEVEPWELMQVSPLLDVMIDILDINNNGAQNLDLLVLNQCRQNLNTKSAHAAMFYRNDPDHTYQFNEFIAGLATDRASTLEFKGGIRFKCDYSESYLQSVQDLRLEKDAKEKRREMWALAVHALEAVLAFNIGSYIVPGLLAMLPDFLSSVVAITEPAISTYMMGSFGMGIYQGFYDLDICKNQNNDCSIIKTQLWLDAAFVLHPVLLESGKSLYSKFKATFFDGDAEYFEEEQVVHAVSAEVVTVIEAEEVRVIPDYGTRSTGGTSEWLKFLQDDYYKTDYERGDFNVPEFFAENRSAHTIEIKDLGEQDGLAFKEQIKSLIAQQGLVLADEQYIHIVVREYWKDDGSGALSQTRELAMWPSTSSTENSGFLLRNGGHLQLADFMWGDNRANIQPGERWYGGGIVVDKDFNAIDVPDSRYKGERINAENPSLRSTLQGEDAGNISRGGNKTLDGQAKDTFKAIVYNIFKPSL